MRLRRPSHTTVIAYLALFIALAGTAVAAKKIGPSGLQKNAVTAKKIEDGAVTTGKIKDGAVTEPKLGNDAVTGNQLAPQSVGTNKLKDDAVESAKLANGAVVEAKIGNDAVNGSKVADGSLTLADYARAVIDASPDPPNIGTGTCAYVDAAAPGVQAGDMPLVLVPDPAVNNNVVPSSVVSPGSAAGTVRVLFCNYTGAPVDSGPYPLKIALLR